MSCGRLGFTAVERRALWERWRAGDSLSAIARVLGDRDSAVRREVARCGGFPPRERVRRAGSLSLVEREEISRGLAAGVSVRAVAAGLGRSASTVSREINRNGGRCRYR